MHQFIPLNWYTFQALCTIAAFPEKSMKLTIKMLLALLVLVGAAVGMTYKLPKQCIAEKSIVVRASADQVFAYLENPTEWQRWSAWNKAYDPTMIQLFGGPMRGSGARITWNGDKIGRKFMVFTNSLSPSQLVYEVTHDEQEHKTQGSFELKETKQGTLVHWKEQTMLHDSPIDLIKGAWKQYKSDTEMEQGLLGLKTLVQQNSKKSATR